MHESSTVSLVSLVDHGARFLLRLLEGVSPHLLRYSDAQRLARSLRRVVSACELKLALLEEVR